MDMIEDIMLLIRRDQASGRCIYALSMKEEVVVSARDVDLAHKLIPRCAACKTIKKRASLQEQDEDYQAMKDDAVRMFRMCIEDIAIKAAETGLVTILEDEVLEEEVSML